jgi:hypothetical protein
MARSTALRLRFAHLAPRSTHWGLDLMSPARGVQHQRLDLFIGRWIGTAEIYPTKWNPGGSAKGIWRFRWDAGRLNLIHSYRETRQSGVFEGNGVFTVDCEHEQLLWFWFDNHGFPPLNPSVGSWADDGALILTKSTPRGVGTSVFRLHEDDILQFSATSQAVGESTPVPVVSGIYRRQEAITGP